MHFAQDGSALLKRWTRLTIKYARTVVSISVFLSLLIAFYTANNLGICLLYTSPSPRDRG